MDYIDERNRKEKMARSIIKRRNVIYTYRPLVKEPPKEQEEVKEELAAKGVSEAPREENAQEVLRRITEARPSGGGVQQEVAHLLAEEEEKKLEIERILHEKDAIVEQVKHAVLQQ